MLTPDGKEIIESRDSKGIFHSSKVTLKPWGFVADVKPDLNAAQVLPGLFLSVNFSKIKFQIQIGFILQLNLQAVKMLRRN